MRNLIVKSRKRKAADIPEEIIAIKKNAEKGYPLEQVLWGKILLDSTYVPRNHTGAITWFKIAAQSQFGPAYNMLGRCAHFGWGCQQDFSEAVRYYAMAANLGDLWGRYNLGIMTMRGIGTEQNIAEAFVHFENAAQGGHAKSMNLYARFLEEGWGRAQDRAAALQWYQRSADGGDYRGQHNYATALLEKGDTELALQYWSHAVGTATQDILRAMDRVLSQLEHPEAARILGIAKARLNALMQASTTTT